MKQYTASKSLPPGRQVWVMSFRHPLRRDPKGKLGLKIRRSLGTTLEAEADRLVLQMNELLSDATLHSLLKRQEADRRFDSIVVSAFYDALEASTTDPIKIREREIPIPKDGVPKVLLAGPTGSGKTSLLRQLIGSDPKNDRFPSTSTARTTTSDIEVIVTPGDDSFRSVVTFRSQWETTASVSECVSSACLAALHDLPLERIAERLLHHPDQIFRLNYVLGPYVAAGHGGDAEWTYEGEQEQGGVGGDPSDPFVSAEHRLTMQSVLDGFVMRIRRLAQTAREKTERDLDIKFEALPPADMDFAEEYFEDMAEDQPEFDALVDDILDQILSRFDHLPTGDRADKPGGWPESWKCECSAHERDEFIRRIRWFSSNYAPAFGQLVTPLVQGIRVRGPFRPCFTSERFDLVLFDGQGFGHTPESAASVSTHITKRYADVDAILLVDNATQPMLAASLSVLRSVLASGYQRKLAIAFTHTDHVEGPNLPDFSAKRAHVMRSIAAALGGLRETLGASLVEMLERDLDRRCFMLGWLDRPITVKSKGPAREMKQLLAICRDLVLPEIPTEAVPVYDPAGLLFAAQSADGQFQELWKARLGFIVLATIQRKHWATIKALNRRIALSMDNGEYADLRPVAELVARLSESIGRFLDKPFGWHGPVDAVQRQTAINRVRQHVFAELHKFVEDRLVANPLPAWVRAFDDSGRYSTSRRAQAIKDIVEGAAPMPNEAMSRDVAAFLRDLRILVHQSIKEAGGLFTSGEAA